MTVPDNSSRLNQPAAPHARPHDALTPGLYPVSPHSEPSVPGSEEQWPDPSTPSNAPPNLAGVAVAEVFLLFLFGAPILLIVIALAAVFDVWTPWSPDRAPIRPPLAK